jgi:hypothetical protein
VCGLLLLLLLVPVQEYCPEAADLPTTNGPWATGDGIQLGTGLGAALVGMEHVQVGVGVPGGGGAQGWRVGSCVEGDSREGQSDRARATGQGVCLGTCSCLHTCHFGAAHEQTLLVLSRVSTPQIHPTGFVDPADPMAGTKVRHCQHQLDSCSNGGCLLAPLVSGCCVGFVVKARLPCS